MWSPRWAFMMDVEVEGRRWTGSWGGEHWEESLNKPGVEMGVGSLGETWKSLIPGGTGVRAGALCHGQDDRQPLEVGPVSPDGMSPLSRKSPSGPLSHLGAHGACSPLLSLRKGELRGAGSPPSRQQEAQN